MNGVTEDEMLRWHHRVNELEFEQTLGESEGQGSLVRCSPWGHRVGHDLATEQYHSPLSVFQLHRESIISYQSIKEIRRPSAK